MVRGITDLIVTADRYRHWTFLHNRNVEKLLHLFLMPSISYVVSSNIKRASISLAMLIKPTFPY